MTNGKIFQYQMRFWLFSLLFKIKQNSIRIRQNILIHIEQTLKLKKTITKILVSVTKIIQPAVVLLT